VDEKDQRVMSVKMYVRASKTTAYIILRTKPHSNSLRDESVRRVTERSPGERYAAVLPILPRNVGLGDLRD
jgi:hypothetical protein